MHYVSKILILVHEFCYKIRHLPCGPENIILLRLKKVRVQELSSKVHSQCFTIPTGSHDSGSIACIFLSEEKNPLSSTKIPSTMAFFLTAQARRNKKKDVSIPRRFLYIYMLSAPSRAYLFLNTRLYIYIYI